MIIAKRQIKTFMPLVNVRFGNKIYGLVAPGYDMAHMSTKLKLMGVDVASIKPKLLGAVLVGDAKEYNDLLQMMLNGLALPEVPESLIMPGFEQSAGKSGGSGVDLLPDSATIVHVITYQKRTSAKQLAMVRPL
uniref:Uncharacterized protein n=1 Tax=Ditylenchus dipsaci TaxID=166011 RepID=A0A915DVN7_9BILA